MLAHALFPQIPQGLLPVSIKKLGNLIQMTVFKNLDILSQLVQSELCLRFASLPDNFLSYCRMVV